MKCGAELLLLLLLLGLVSLGRPAPLSDCDTLVKPITISSKEILGKWLYIGGSSDLPGSRSMVRLMKSVWLNVSETSQSNILNIIQSQRIFTSCSSLIYNVTFENSMMLIEQPFYLKEIYLPTDCSDCLVALEEIISGTDKFTSLMLFSKSRSLSTNALDMFKRQAECLRMPSPLMPETDDDICPDDIPPVDGLSAIHSLFENKIGQHVASFLDKVFDMFLN